MIDSTQQKKDLPFIADDSIDVASKMNAQTSCKWQITVPELKISEEIIHVTWDMPDFNP